MSFGYFDKLSTGPLTTSGGVEKKEYIFEMTGEQRCERIGKKKETVTPHIGFYLAGQPVSR
jgi:hypothetical protein